MYRAPLSTSGGQALQVSRGRGGAGVSWWAGVVGGADQVDQRVL